VSWFYFPSVSRIALALAAVSAGACTMLGPDYQEPEVAWLNNWRPGLHGLASGDATGGADELAFWWELFGNPKLNELVALVRKENPSLRIAGLRILESRARLGVAGSGLYPQVQQADSAVSYVNTQRYGGALPDDNQSLASYQAGFSVAWELDFWGRFRRGIESADAAFFAAIANQQDVQVLLTAQVADLYFAYRTTEQRIAIAHENVALQKRSYEISERKFKSGGDSELDLQQAKTQYLATLSTIPQLEIALTQVRNALCTLLGRPPGDLAELGTGSHTLPEITAIEPRHIPAPLLLRRPDVRTAAWQIAAQSAQIGLAEAEFYPAVSLLGGINWSGDSLSGTPYVGGLGVGPSLRWNLFDHGRIRNNVRLQDAALQQLIEQYQATVLQAAREIDDAAIGVVKTAEQEAIINESVDAARRALELANTRYREGLANFQRVLDAQRALFSQTERRIINHGNYISAVVSLYKGLGGGWQPTPVESLIPGDVRDRMQERTDWGELLSAPLPDGQSERPPTSKDAK
jgi:NodT family efflux transporter outer membrane factor (OMF) lipoprotein